MKGFNMKISVEGFNFDRNAYILRHASQDTGQIN